MRKRLLTKKYLRDVNEYIIDIIKDDNSYVCVKKIISVDIPFSISPNLCLINNGYYIVEILPLNDNFCIRTFLNDKKEILQKYIDISLKNGIDNETNIPYYDDIYLDIIITGNDVYIDDIDELEHAYHNKEITIKEYDEAYTVCNKLLSVSEIVKRNSKKILIEASDASLSEYRNQNDKFQMYNNNKIENNIIYRDKNKSPLSISSLQ